jgi:hypothetical protein
VRGAQVLGEGTPYALCAADTGSYGAFGGGGAQVSLRRSQESEDQKPGIRNASLGARRPTWRGRVGARRRATCCREAGMGRGSISRAGTAAYGSPGDGKGGNDLARVAWAAGRAIGSAGSGYAYGEIGRLLGVAWMLQRVAKGCIWLHRCCIWLHRVARARSGKATAMTRGREGEREGRCSGSLLNAK